MKPDYIGAEKFILEQLDKKLPKDLFYHGLHHTRDVYAAAMLIAASEGVSEDNLNLLKIAVIFHDAGFLYKYKNHEEAGCELVLEILPAFGFDTKRIKIIEGMIMATQIPQSAKTQLERIICDADLDYLGRNDFKPIAKTLFNELKVYMNIKDEKVWNNIQLNFLKNHRYYTEFSQQNREAKKQKHLKEIIKIVESYSKPIEAKKPIVKKVTAKKTAPKKTTTK